MTAMATLHAAHVAPLGLRRVYILPTRHGLLLLVLLLIILLGAINYDNALAYLLCFLLGGLFLVAMLHTYRNLAGLSMAATAVAPVVAGEPAVFMLQLASDVARPRYQLRLMQRALKTAVTLDLHSHTGAMALVLPTHRRGRLSLQQVRLESTFPLGVLRAWAYFKSPAECICIRVRQGISRYPGGPTLPLPEKFDEDEVDTRLAALAPSGRTASSRCGMPNSEGMPMFSDPARLRAVVSENWA